MNSSKPGGLVEFVTHTSRTINGENVVLHKREWVRPDDPRLPTSGNCKIVSGSSANQAGSARGSSCGAGPTGCIGGNEGAARLDPAREKLADILGEASIAQCEATAEGPWATEGAHATRTEVAPKSSKGVLTKARNATTSLMSNPSVPKTELHPETDMSNYDQNEEDYHQDAELEAEEKDDNDRPWPITKRTLVAIENMSPTELEDLIENVDDHESWQELREDAKRRIPRDPHGIERDLGV